jgi:hypothetical protein
MIGPFLRLFSALGSILPVLLHVRPVFGAASSASKKGPSKEDRKFEYKMVRKTSLERLFVGLPLSCFELSSNGLRLELVYNSAFAFNFNTVVPVLAKF